MMYHRRGLSVNTVQGDLEFKPLASLMQELPIVLTWQNLVHHALPQGKVQAVTPYTSVFADILSHNCLDGAGLHHDLEHVP